MVRVTCPQGAEAPVCSTTAITAPLRTTATTAHLQNRVTLLAVMDESF